MICIYISDDKIKLLDGSFSSNRINISGFYDISTKAGSMEGDAIKDLVVFTQSLQDCLQSTNIKPGKVTYVLDSSRVVFREMIVPDVPDAKLKKVIVSELFSDAKAAANTVDYVVLDKFKGENKTAKLRIMVTYVSNEVIDNLHTSAMELNLQPVVLDIAPNTIVKLIGQYGKNAADRKLLESSFVLVDYKDTFITISIFEDLVNKFSKSTALMSNDPTNPDAAYLSSELTGQLVNTLRYYQSRNDESEIKAIYVTGNVSVLDNSVLQNMADSTGIMISVLPLPSFVKGLSLFDFNAFSDALGAFIRR